MDEETKKLLKDILFQLHVITSQNATFMANFQNEAGRERLREAGLNMLLQETKWMGSFVLGKTEVEECHSGTVSSSDS